MTDSRPADLRRILRRATAPVRRHVLLNRRRWSAALLAAAALVAVSSTQPTPTPTTEIVVAATDLPGGSVLDARDLDVRSVPTALAPAYAAHQVETLLGRRLAVGLRGGEPVGAHRLAGSEQRRAAPGLTTVPVRIADGASLLRAGDVIDLVAADSDGQGRTIARTLPVIGTATDETSTGGFDAAGSGDGSLVLLGVPSAYVPDVVGASSAGHLLFTFSP